MDCHETSYQNLLQTALTALNCSVLLVEQVFKSKMHTVKTCTPGLLSASTSTP